MKSALLRQLAAHAKASGTQACLAWPAYPCYQLDLVETLLHQEGRAFGA